MRRADWDADIDEQISKLDLNTKAGRKKAKQLENRKLVDAKPSDPGVIKYDPNGEGKHIILINEAAAKESNNQAVVLHELLHAVLRKAVLKSPKSVKGLSYMLQKHMIENPEMYDQIAGYVTTSTDEAGKAVYPKVYPKGHEKAGQKHPKAGQLVREGTGKFDQYKWEKEINNLAPDELFTVFAEAMAQGNIRVESNFITKIGDFKKII